MGTGSHILTYLVHHLQTSAYHSDTFCCHVQALSHVKQHGVDLLGSLGLLILMSFTQALAEGLQQNGTIDAEQSR